MLPVSLVQFVKKVPGTIFFICRPGDAESRFRFDLIAYGGSVHKANTVVWFLTDLLIKLLFILTGSHVQCFKMNSQKLTEV
jgi:hypothetical protein